MLVALEHLGQVVQRSLGGDSQGVDHPQGFIDIVQGLLVDLYFSLDLSGLIGFEIDSDLGISVDDGKVVDVGLFPGDALRCLCKMLFNIVLEVLGSGCLEEF